MLIKSFKLTFLGEGLMVKISYQPIKDIIIHEIVQYKPEEYLTLVIQSTLAAGGAGTTPTLNWANGIIFSHVGYPDNEDIIKERLAGVLHYAAVNFAVYPEYKPQVTIRIGEQSYSVKLQRVDSNPIFVELADYLKNGKYR